MTTEAEDRFNNMASYVRIATEELLTDMFGERCDVYEPSCEVCRRWKLLDDLLESPFD